MGDPTSKTCSQCSETKPLAEFPRYGKCRTCLAEASRRYRRENPDRVRATEARRYVRRAIPARADAKRRYEADPEAARDKARRYYESEDREARNAVRKAWRDAHPDKQARYTEDYRRRNPLAATAMRSNRRARIGGQRVTISELKSIWTGDCALCGSPIDTGAAFPAPLSKSIDHIIPLAKGGAHEVTNLQWVHFLCNCLKGDRLPPD